MTSYQEECRLRAQMLLDAADWVELQIRSTPSSEWADIREPDFSCSVNLYRRKPKKVRHERVVVWARWPNGAICVLTFKDHNSANQGTRDMEELKREIVFVEIEE